MNAAPDDIAAEVLRRPSRLGGIRLVAIDGPSGAGKSVLAVRLASSIEAAIGERTPIVNTDDLLAGWDDQFTFWERLETTVLEPLRNGRPARHQRFDWSSNRFADELTSVPPQPVIILEGVSAARARIRPELTLAIFVTAPPDLRLKRVLERDGHDVLPYLEKWRLGEERHFAADATAQHADFVLDGAALEA